MKKIIAVCLILLLPTTLFAEESLSNYLQSISVMVKAGFSSGSGVIITRNIKPDEDSEKCEQRNFILTAGHVVDGLKKSREVIDSKTGQKRMLVEFDSPKIMQMMVEDGRKVGETTLDTKVIRFSDIDVGEDLAVLLVMKKGFTDKSAKFYLEDNEIELGTDVWHVGSFLGEIGSNSMSKGILSQKGRIIDNKVYNQFSCPGFPGSSGGGIFLKDGRYIATLVRGAGESFTLSVPIERIRKWTNKIDMEWLINPELEPPTLEEILDKPVDDVGQKFYSESSHSNEFIEEEYKLMLHEE